MSKSSYIATCGSSGKLYTGQGEHKGLFTQSTFAAYWASFAHEKHAQLCTDTPRNTPP